MRNLVYGLACAGVVAWSSQAMAVCEEALVKATYVRSSSVSDRSELADLVDEHTYQEITHGADASATIFGIPVGADYNDFRKSVESYKRDHRESYSKDVLENIAWTGLDSGSPEAYRSCLEHDAITSNGLHAAVISATQTNVTILVHWFVPGDARPAEVTWSPNRIGRDKLPTSFPQGETDISVPRPQQEVELSVNFHGYASSVHLTPLPKPDHEKSSSSIASTAIDFDGDGVADTFDHGADGFVVHLAHRKNVDSPNNAQFPPGAEWVTGDFDGDGLTDIAVITITPDTSGYVQVYRSNGNGKFGYKSNPTDKFVFAQYANAEHQYATGGTWTAVACTAAGKGRWALKHMPTPGLHDPLVLFYYWIPDSVGAFHITGVPVANPAADPCK